MKPEGAPTTIVGNPFFVWGPKTHKGEVSPNPLGCKPPENIFRELPQFWRRRGLGGKTQFSPGKSPYTRYVNPKKSAGKKISGGK